MNFNCACSDDFNLSGIIVTRSFMPLPLRTMICSISKSISCTRNRMHSISLSPLPYSTPAIVRYMPFMECRTMKASSCVNTVGTLSGFFARLAFIESSSLTPNTSWYRNNIALKAWFCVEDATLRSFARQVQQCPVKFLQKVVVG